MTAAEADARYRTAGAVYLVAGLGVVVVTVLGPGMTGPNRASEMAHLATALPAFLAFGAAVAFGDRAVAWLRRRAGNEPDVALASGRSFRRGLAIVLTVTAVGRTVVFAANGGGWRPRLREGGALVPVDGTPAMFVAAALTATIAVALTRAWWPRIDDPSPSSEG